MKHLSSTSIKFEISFGNLCILSSAGSDGFVIDKTYCRDINSYFHSYVMRNIVFTVAICEAKNRLMLNKMNVKMSVRGREREKAKERQGKTVSPQANLQY